MTPLRVLVLALFAAGCSSAAETTAAPPDVADATNEGVTVVTRAEPMADGALSSYCAGESGEAVQDSIVVSPATLDLEVGSVTSLLAFTSTSAGSGERVPTMISVDSPIARIENGGVLALAPGTVGLEFRPLCAVVEGDSGTVPAAVVQLVISE